MLTLFSIPKPFQGHISIIQRNAIASWSRLEPKPEIILFGDEDGTEKAAAEVEALHEPVVIRNEYGTPLLHDIFARASSMAANDIMCFVNADILLMSDFMQAVACASTEKKQFLMVAHRWDVEIREPLDFQPGWENSLQECVARKGKLHGPTGIDFFVFPKKLWGEIPPFAVGRPAYDNWLLFRARQLGVPLIDATPTVMAVHQNHHYKHNPRGKQGIWDGPEAKRNRQLAGGEDHLFILLHASHLLTKSGVRRALNPWCLRRQVEITPALHPRLALPAQLLLWIMDALLPLASRCKRLLRAALGH